MRTVQAAIGFVLALAIGAPFEARAGSELRRPDEHDYRGRGFRAEGPWQRERLARSASELASAAGALQVALDSIPGTGVLAREANELARAAARFARDVANAESRSAVLSQYRELQRSYDRLRNDLIATHLQLHKTVYRAWDAAVVRFEHVVLGMGVPAYSVAGAYAQR